MSVTIYEMVTNKIIKRLETGEIPWRKPWINGANGAINWKTQRPYRGINAFILEPGEYATFKQIQEAGGSVKKGERGSIVVFWKWIEKENEETSETVKIPFLRYYTVFDINRQCEGITSKRNFETFEHDPIIEAEKIVAGYIGGPMIHYILGEAFYKPSLDYIQMPPINHFPKAEDFYSVLFHEMIHSTGHPKRLCRPGIEKVAAFGSESYSKEELVAEMGAAMLCGVSGIDNSTIENSAAYIQGWLKALKNDKKMVIQAAAQAQKAADYIMGYHSEEENE